MSAADYLQQFANVAKSALQQVAAGFGPPDRGGASVGNTGQGDRGVRGFLSKNESFFVVLQKLILWENVALSSIFVTCFTFVYWFLASMRPLGLLFEVLLIYYAYIVIFRQVRGAISVEPTPEQVQDQKESEEWTLMEKSVFSAPELQIAFERFSKIASHYFDVFVAFRRDQPKNYAVTMLGIFSTAGFVGTIVSGPVLLYGVLLFLLTAPGMIHNSAQLNQLFWALICGPDPSPEADKHVEEFLWKASREDLNVLEQAANTNAPDSLAYFESQIAPTGSGLGFHEEPTNGHGHGNGNGKQAVSKDSSESGSLADETLEKIHHDQIDDEDEVSSFEEYDPGEFPSMDSVDHDRMTGKPSDESES